MLCEAIGRQHAPGNKASIVVEDVVMRTAFPVDQPTKRSQASAASSMYYLIRGPRSISVWHRLRNCSEDKWATVDGKVPPSITKQSLFCSDFPRASSTSAELGLVKEYAMDFRYYPLSFPHRYQLLRAIKSVLGQNRRPCGRAFSQVARG
jgi:hypothetical protein